MNTLDDETPEQKRALDALLASDRVPPPSAALREAIVHDFRSRGGGFWRGLLRELGGPWTLGPALAASVALGIGLAAMIGVAPPAPEPAVADDPSVEYIELALLDGGEYEDYLP